MGAALSREQATREKTGGETRETAKGRPTGPRHRRLGNLHLTSAPPTGEMARGSRENAPTFSGRATRVLTDSFVSGGTGEDVSIAQAAMRRSRPGLAGGTREGIVFISVPLAVNSGVGAHFFPPFVGEICLLCPPEADSDEVLEPRGRWGGSRQKRPPAPRPAGSPLPPLLLRLRDA